ncbi:MAG TPA: hypothetical protein VJ942_09505, partial [Roseovarius sp.]|nr:hypothetical protein [Roseovarius sp.]
SSSPSWEPPVIRLRNLNRQTGQPDLKMPESALNPGHKRNCRESGFVQPAFGMMEQAEFIESQTASSRSFLRSPRPFRQDAGAALHLFASWRSGAYRVDRSRWMLRSGP